MKSLKKLQFSLLLGEVGNSSSTEDCKNESLQMECITFLIKEHIQYFMILVLLNNLTGHKLYANVCCGENHFWQQQYVFGWIATSHSMKFSFPTDSYPISLVSIEIQSICWDAMKYELRCKAVTCTLRSFTYFKVNLKVTMTVNYTLYFIA